MHSQTSQPGQRRDNNKGHNKYQKKYVPKANDSASTTKLNEGKGEPNGSQNHDESRSGSLTSSLRQSSEKVNYRTGGQGGKIKQNDGSRRQVWRSGGSNEKSLPKKQGNYVKYLPQDDAVATGLGVEDGGIDVVETQGIADLLNQELRSLLRMKPREFWREVATDGSLHEFLDSYLRFRKRWYDLPDCRQSGSMAGLVVGDQELSRRVFMVLYRMSSNHDPGAHASECLSSKEHTDLLWGKKLLDIPKLMDISAIYGCDNADLTRSLVFNVLKSQPGWVDDLMGVVPQFLCIVDTMHQRCRSTVDALSASGNNETSSIGRLREDLLEVMDFINDAVATMDAFVEAYLPAAAFFMSSSVSNEGNEELLPSLASLHVSLLPILHKGFTFLTKLTADKGYMSASDDMELMVQPRLKKLSARIVKFAWQLLYICYLSQTLAQDDCQYPSTKVFPAQVEDPVVRGDILVQVIGEIAVGSSSSADRPSSSGSFLWNLDRRHKLMNNLDELCQSEWIRLDEAQYGYISLLAGHSESSQLKGNGMDVKGPDISTVSLKDRVTSDEETVILQSKISQIKDIFPDYGDGFISACLDVYNDNPEEVIQQILEGTLHSDLLSLDTSLQTKPTSKSSSLNKKDKGKGMLDESAHTVKDKVILDASYSEKIIGSSSSSAIESSPLPPDVKSSASGRYVRRQKGDLDAARILDQQDVKDTFRSAILAAQYEDEYDDSFDDLGMSVADAGIEETESLGDGLRPRPTPRWAVESTLNDIDSSGKLNSVLSNKAWNENSANVSHEKSVSGLVHPHLNGSAPSGQRGSHGSYGKGKWKEQQKPQFYVKDGKNYSYKVAGAVAVSSAEEAEVLKKTEEETIYGLGAGGNVPFKAIDSSLDTVADHNTHGARTTRGGSQRGRGSYGRGGAQGDKAVHVRKDHDNHHRKDRAMKKHFSGVGGY